jgi:transcriptional regulator with XRE-family HTH domain
MAKPKQSAGQLRLGQAIRARRAGLGLSLADLAGDLGIAPSSLSKLENGLTPITFERLETIARLLDVDMAALLGGARSAAPATPEPQASGSPPRREEFGTRRAITRSGEAAPVEGGVYTLEFHAADLLEKRCQPMVAQVHCTDIRDYGPLTRHAGEEFNYVVSGALEFHTDVYAPVVLRAGDSIYFDSEMGHAHIRVGDEPCTMVAMILAREGKVEHNFSPALKIRRGGSGDAPQAAPEATLRV